MTQLLAHLKSYMSHVLSGSRSWGKDSVVNFRVQFRHFNATKRTRLNESALIWRAAQISVVTHINDTHQQRNPISFFDSVAFECLQHI